MFIALEGGEGAGKSTQVRLLAERLRALGRDVIETFEPGATRLGAALRSLVLESDRPIAPWAEAYIYAADRAQHVAETLRPALDSGTDVVSDRFVLSSIAYQGVARGLGIDAVAELNRQAVDGVVPDVTIVLDIAPDLGLRRAGAGGHDRIESESIEFHAQVRDAFRSLSGREDVVLVDAAMSSAEVADDLWQIVAGYAQRRGIDL